MPNKFWTEQEESKLLELAKKDTPNRQIAKQLRRTESSIERKLNKLRSKRNKLRR